MSGGPLPTRCNPQEAVLRETEERAVTGYGFYQLTLAIHPDLRERAGILRGTADLKEEAAIHKGRNSSLPQNRYRGAELVLDSAGVDSAYFAVDMLSDLRVVD